MAAGWRRERPDDDLELVPMADGGEGTMEALVAALGGRAERARVAGPLGDPLDSAFGIAQAPGSASSDERIGVVEMARASGLALLARLEARPAPRHDARHRRADGGGDRSRRESPRRVHRGKRHQRRRGRHGGCPRRPLPRRGGPGDHRRRGGPRRPRAHRSVEDAPDGWVRCRYRAPATWTTRSPGHRGRARSTGRRRAPRPTTSPCSIAPWGTSRRSWSAISASRSGTSRERVRRADSGSA